MLVQARQAARRAGTLSDDLDRLVQGILQPRTQLAGCPQALQFQDQTRSGSSWSRPEQKACLARRHPAQP